MSDGAAGPLARALEARIPGLDFVRAVAVMCVLLDHHGLSTIGPVTVFDGGVEAFFVLSGFLITWMLLREQASRGHIALGPFYRRRAARLLPAFYAYVALGAALLTLRHRPVPWGAVASASLYVVNYYQALTGAESHYLSHAWSLAVEEQFYVLWPLALALLFARRAGLARALAMAIAVPALLRPLLLFGFGVGDAYLYRALETRADHLLWGCLLAVLLREERHRARFEALAARAWALPLLALLRVGSTTLQHVSPAWKYGLAYAMDPVLVALALPLIVLAGARARGAFGRLVGAGPVVLVGQISYGVYLLHPLVMHPVRNALEARTASTLLGVVVSILAVLGVAWVSFRFFETPLRERLTRPAARPRVDS